LWSNCWSEDWQGKPKYSEKTCPSATLSHHKSHMPRSGFEPPDRSGGKPATNRLSYGAALTCNLLWSWDSPATGYGLSDRGSVENRDKRLFFLLHSVQTGSGAYSASYPMGTEGKAVGRVKLTSHLRLLLKSRMVELYLPSPMRLDDMALN
jgi:hypothetical protein